MTRMVRLLCFSLLIGSSIPALAMEDTPQNRATEASRYLQAAPMEGVVTNMAGEMASSLPQEQQQAFTAAMQKNTNMQAINQAAQAALVKTFTADELKALADFYSSPQAKSAMAKMESYMSEAMPAIMKEVDAAAQKAQQQTGAKLPREH